VTDLSEQQRQVLQCIDEGLDYRATARVMNISDNTVKEYLARIRDKYREQGHTPGNSHHLTKLAYDEGHLR
jgi:DNA-directed RNA polymerase specialized sigma24 family protein